VDVFGGLVVDEVIRLGHRNDPVEVVVEVQVDVRGPSLVFERDGERAGRLEPIGRPDRVNRVPVQFDGECRRRMG